MYEYEFTVTEVIRKNIFIQADSFEEAEEAAAEFCNTDEFCADFDRNFDDFSRDIKCVWSDEPNEGGV